MNEIDSQKKFDIMTPEEVAQYLSKSLSWVYKNWQRQVQIRAKDKQEETQAKDESCESVAKESTKPSDVSGVVEGVQVKTGRPLPLLRDKRKHAGIKGVRS
jgi:hypothetical protein